MSAATKKGLGRSFESLIPTDLFDESFDPTSIQDSKVSKLVNLNLDDISPDPSQPRSHFDEEALNSLATSIREHGVLQPIVVIKSSPGKYTIVAGERRWRASGLAGLTNIPAIVRSLNDQTKLELSLIENIQRRDLNVIEIATAYLKLREQFNLTLEDISARVGGSSPSAIANKIRLLKLPNNVKQAVVDGQLTEGQARPLLSASPEIINRVLPLIIQDKWSSRQIEQFMVQVRGKKIDQKAKKSLKGKTTPYATETKHFEKVLGSKVTIRTSSRGSGEIIIKFKDEDDFHRQLDLLLPEKRPK